jgi:hypothetical protein
MVFRMVVSGDSEKRAVGREAKERGIEFCYSMVSKFRIVVTVLSASIQNSCQCALSGGDGDGGCVGELGGEERMRREGEALGGLVTARGTHFEW